MKPFSTRLARTNEVQLHVMLDGPRIHGFARKLATVIDRDRNRTSMLRS
jgi:hypothetical protein